MPIAALFVRQDSHYKQLGLDCYDIDRDARTYAGAAPVIAHPPCRAWGKLAHMAKPRPDEKQLAFFAVQQVRKNGGVLEHPEGSRLWAEAGLPLPGAGRDEFGGYTFVVDQCWFGHVARKRTLLYIVGCEPAQLPSFDMSQQATKANLKHGTSTKTREATPPRFAAWLVQLAASCAA